MFSVQWPARLVGRRVLIVVLSGLSLLGKIEASKAEDLRVLQPRSKTIPSVHMTAVKIKGGIVQASTLETLLKTQLKMDISDTTVSLSLDDRLFNSLERASGNAALQVMNVHFKVHPDGVRGRFSVACRLYYAEEEFDNYAFLIGGCEGLDRTFYLSRSAVFKGEK